MGGLWEAAIKSFKIHFKKVTGSRTYTFEEFATLLIRIEGVLNSRPLSAMSNNAQEYLALTPGHFLRGAPLVALPEAHSADLSLINRWEKTKAQFYLFSERWKHEYLVQLNQRYKWKTQRLNVKIDDLVIVKEDGFPPTEWCLGRIEQLHSSPDGNVRVVDVRTARGIITRPITKICLLPSRHVKN